MTMIDDDDEETMKSDRKNYKYEVDAVDNR